VISSYQVSIFLWRSLSGHHNPSRYEPFHPSRNVLIETGLAVSPLIIGVCLLGLF